ncbi:MAG: peptidylprolyl isomerase [Woeseiaceae bacterium]|nr:peptidylprolyl isomerase [Woeseiaceae bacterium]NIP20925.1 peptidylprolyl isomerase [Woeseiaceae bacterium]NIS89692.1 peptidylprolyl isomerase [Woeseiaceae bacterium]
MNIDKRSGLPGAFVALAVTGTLAATANAETVFTVNDVSVDSSVVNMYLESRIQRPADQATEEERMVVMQELTDIYLLTTQPSAQSVADDERVKAQIELQSRAVLAQAIAGDFFANNPASEEEILAAYEQQMKVAPDQQFKARHILVDTQAAAMDLISQLDEGADFAELAMTHSTGPTGPNGGDLGWFSPDQMVPQFSEAVSALEDGAHTAEPVQTQFGWHVILREDSRANQPPTLDSVRDVIKQRVEQEKFQVYLETLRADYASKN